MANLSHRPVQRKLRLVDETHVLVQWSQGRRRIYRKMISLLFRRYRLRVRNFIASHSRSPDEHVSTWSATADLIVEYGYRHVMIGQREDYVFLNERCVAEGYMLVEDEDVGRKSYSLHELLSEAKATLIRESCYLKALSTYTGSLYRVYTVNAVNGECIRQESYTFDYLIRALTRTPAVKVEYDQYTGVVILYATTDDQIPVYELYPSFRHANLSQFTFGKDLLA